MTATHDFSKPKPPAPSSQPPAAPPRGRPPNLVLAAAAVAVVAVVIGLVLFLRGGKDGTPEMVDSRFCQASLQLTDALGGIGVAPVGPIPESVRPEALKGALDGVGADAIAVLERTAPPKVRGDVKRVVADLRAAASGDMASARSAAFTQAEGRIEAIKQPPSGCPVQDSSSGDG